MKANPNWTFEGEVFHVVPPAQDGACAAGTIPVYRVYNDGMGAAPNHRLMTDIALQSEMVTKGWVPEGRRHRHHDVRADAGPADCRRAARPVASRRARAPRTEPSAATPSHCTPCASRNASAPDSSSIAIVAQLPATTHSGDTTLIDCQCVDRHAGARIHDVAVPPAADVEVPLVVAARRERAGREVEARHGGVVAARMADADAPRRAVGLRSDRADVAAQVHEPVAQSALEEDRRDAVRRVFLADAAEVDLHARARQVHGLRVPLDVGPADVRDGGGEFVRVRQRRRVALEVPHAPEHARRDVEESARERVALVGVAQQRRGLRVDRHRRSRPRRG